MKTAIKSAEKTTQTQGSKAPLGHGVGRRKSSVARVWLRRGKGTITVNNRAVEAYFDVEPALHEVRLPMNACPFSSNYDIQVNVFGGGTCSQAGATKLAIARAFLDVDETSRALLREHNLLTSDARVKERKKYGQKGARRKFQFVKR